MMKLHLYKTKPEAEAHIDALPDSEKSLWSVVPHDPTLHCDYSCLRAGSCTGGGCPNWEVVKVTQQVKPIERVTSDGQALDVSKIAPARLPFVEGAHPSVVVKYEQSGGHGPWFTYVQPPNKERAVIRATFHRGYPELDIFFPPREHDYTNPGYFSSSATSPYVSSCEWTYVEYKRNVNNKETTYFVWIESKHCPSWVKHYFPFKAFKNIDTVLDAYDQLTKSGQFETDPIDYYGAPTR